MGTVNKFSNNINIFAIFNFCRIFTIENYRIELSLKRIRFTDSLFSLERKIYNVF